MDSSSETQSDAPSAPVTDHLTPLEGELLEALLAMVAWANSSGAGGGYPGTQAGAAIAKAVKP